MATGVLARRGHSGTYMYLLKHVDRSIDPEPKRKRTRGREKLLEYTTPKRNVLTLTMHPKPHDPGKHTARSATTVRAN
jgi:hypothetical protein